MKLAEFHRRLGIAWPTQQLSASQEGLLHAVRDLRYVPPVRAALPGGTRTVKVAPAFQAHTCGGQFPTPHGLLSCNSPSAGQEFLPFMEHESSFPCSKQPTIRPCSRPGEFTWCHICLGSILKWSLPAVPSLGWQTFCIQGDSEGKVTFWALTVSVIVRKTLIRTRV
jgi:hypothetical protein